MPASEGRGYLKLSLVTARLSVSRHDPLVSASISHHNRAPATASAYDVVDAETARSFPQRRPA